jgi:hypothetical protein
MEAAARDSVPCYAGQFGKSHLPSQSDRSPPYPIWASTWLALCSASSMVVPSSVLGHSPSGADNRPIVACHQRAPLSPHSPLFLKWANSQKSMNPQPM